MGRIFTWDEVSLGKIPDEDSIEEVADLVHKRLLEEKGVVFAALCGSVVRGDFNIRSDVDCVVVLDSAYESQVRKVTNSLSVFARELYVPVNFIPCDVQIAATGFHHLGPAFVRHVESSIQAGGLIKGVQFLEDLSPSVPLDQEIISYLRIKLYGMMESLASESSFSEEQSVRFFKKGLEVVMHTARKVLIYEDFLVGDSKKDVQARYREMMPVELSTMLDALIDLDRLYSAELYAQLDEGLNEARYRAVLSLVSLGMPSVAQFIRLNILHMSAQTRH